MTEKQYHPSFERLLCAAKDAGVEDRVELASLLHRTTFVIGNWAKRGVSKEGALIAQEKIGCSAAWLLRGREPESIRMPLKIASTTDASQINSSRDFYANDLHAMLTRFNNHDELRTAYIAAITAIDKYFLDLQTKM